MIIPGIASALLNIGDNFYYCGIEISKNSFDVTEFSKVCAIINNLKHQLSSENAKNLSSVRNSTEVISVVPLGKKHRLLVSVNKNKTFVGLYNKGSKEIEPINKEILRLFTNDLFSLVSYKMETIAARYSKGISTSGCDVKNFQELTSFSLYKSRIEKLSTCFYHTYELEFINGYKDYILTDEQLKCSLEEK